MTIDPTTKARALKLLERGLATCAEIANALGISRQAVQHWIDNAGLDPLKAREKLIRRLLRKR